MDYFDMLLARKLSGGGASSEAMISDEYDSTKTYTVGDYCIYDNTLYKCKTAISTPEEWNASHWDATIVTDELSELKTDLADLDKVSIGILSGDVLKITTTKMGDFWFPVIVVFGTIVGIISISGSNTPSITNISGDLSSAVTFNVISNGVSITMGLSGRRGRLWLCTKGISDITLQVN